MCYCVVIIDPVAYMFYHLHPLVSMFYFVDLCYFPWGYHIRTILDKECFGICKKRTIPFLSSLLHFSIYWYHICFFQKSAIFNYVRQKYLFNILKAKCPTFLSLLESFFNTDFCVCRMLMNILHAEYL
jgi:hypothetical protein